MEKSMKQKRGRPRKVTSNPPPTPAKKGNRGRKPSELEFTSLMIDLFTRDRLREFGDYLASRSGETFTLRRTIAWLLAECANPDEMETPEGE